MPIQVAGSGIFHCPSCHQDRPYDMVVNEARRKILGIPLGALEETGRRVVCRECGRRFAPDILFGDAERHAHRVEAALRGGLRGLVVRMVLEDGRVAPQERTVLGRVCEELLGHALSQEELDQEIRAATEDPRAAAEYARDVTPFLSAEERATVLQAAFRVARADGEVHVRERRLLAEIGAALELDPDTIRRVLEPQ